MLYYRKIQNKYFNTDKIEMVEQEYRENSYWLYVHLDNAEKVTLRFDSEEELNAARAVLIGNDFIDFIDYT